MAGSELRHFNCVLNVCRDDPAIFLWGVPLGAMIADYPLVGNASHHLCLIKRLDENSEISSFGRAIPFQGIGSGFNPRTSGQKPFHLLLLLGISFCASGDLMQVQILRFPNPAFSSPALHL